MNPTLKNILKKTVGVILIVWGLIALVTPFTPGSWLAIIGLQMLGWGFLLENRVFRAIKKKFEIFKKGTDKNKRSDNTAGSHS